MDKANLNNLGAEASSAGDFEKAEKYFRQALELSPDDPLICYNIGFTLLKKGEKDVALKWFDTAIENADAPASADSTTDIDTAADNISGKLALDCGLACFEASLYDSA
ncbi:MAG: tetratricopeptide repeat protein, partial [Spirochaetia bacterium]|nr:tetratricopeptide repeat protein [Spirochaetia bacterium]